MCAEWGEGGKLVLTRLAAAYLPPEQKDRLVKIKLPILLSPKFANI